MPTMPTENGIAPVVDDTKTVAGLKKKLEQAKSVLSRYLGVWELNRAFYNGDQWVF